MKSDASAVFQLPLRVRFGFLLVMVRRRLAEDGQVMGAVSDKDADDLLDTARQLRADVVAWLKANHPKLVPPGL